MPPTPPPGMYPEVVHALGATSWGAERSVVFTTIDGVLTYNWQSPVFDTRPDGTAAMPGVAASAIPVNHAGAIGLNHFLNVMIGSRSGLFPPAAQAGLSAFYRENGSPTNSIRMFELTQFVECSDQILDGGTTAAPYSAIPPVSVASGASILAFTPAFPMLKYWQVTIQLRLEADIPGLDLFVMPFIH